MEYLLMPIIGFCGFFLKGAFGLGVNVVILALCSFFIPLKMTVVLIAFVSVFAGLLMLKTDTVRIEKSYWVPVVISIVFGSVLGALLLGAVANHIFEIIFGITFLLMSGWFLIQSHLSLKQGSATPDKSSLKDLIVSAFAGFCAGFVGVNGPPLLLHFGSYLNKQFLRRLFVIIFLPEALAHTLTFAFNGLLDLQVVLYGLSMLPGMFLGVYVGNKAHLKMSEIWFRRLLGLFLLFVSARLIF